MWQSRIANLATYNRTPPDPLYSTRFFYIHTFVFRPIEGGLYAGLPTQHLHGRTEYEQMGEGGVCFPNEPITETY